MRSPIISSFETYMMHPYLYPHLLIEEACDMLTRKDAKGFKDLHMMPVSFGQKVVNLVENVTWQWNDHSETRRETAAS